MSVFKREAGTSTLEWRDCFPLRIRVSMSAMGSDVVISWLSFQLPAGRLPTGLDHARNLSRQREFPETDPAQFELPQIPPRPAAAETAIAMAAPQLGRLGGLGLSQPFVS